VLALLGLHANEAVSEDRLVDALWGDDPPRTATKTIHAYISRLRRALAGAAADESLSIETRPPGYRLRVGPGALDVAEVESLVAQGQEAAAAGDHSWAAVALARAWRTWRGPSLGEFAEAPFAATTAIRLDELRVVALEERIEAELNCGRHAPLVGELEALCSDHPLRERLWGQHMIALYRSGRQAEALRVYQALRTHLGEELGIEPSPGIVALEGRILAQDPALELTATPPAAVRAAPESHLPTGVVTFLLTDIVGSTGLWDTHRTDMAVALERHDHHVADVVESCGGFTIKSKGEGDATLSVFRRASSAAAAALDLRAAFASEAWAGGIPLSMRIALHTGEANERDGDYFGPTVNRAARIRSLAGSGQIVLSEATTALVRDHLPEGCRLIDLGRHELRGLARDELVFELTLPGERSQAPEPSVELDPLVVPLPPVLEARQAIAFVGRDGELDVLNQLWKEAAEGLRRVALIAGEPGIGKTRLASELARTAHDAGAIVLFGRCDEDLGVPYQPFTEALGHFVAHASLHPSVLGELGGELVRLAPDLATKIRGLPSPLQADVETERQRLFDAVAGWLQSVSERSPVVLLLDDLHWASKPTLLLLRHLLRSSETGRLLIIGTYRDTELDRSHPLADALADLRREASPTRLLLHGLDEAATTAFVEAASGQALEDGERAMVGALHAETDGNPFFMGEVMRHLVDTGVIRREDGRWVGTVSTVEGAGLPEGVREVITRRLGRLSETANKALAVASVVGPSFDRSLLELLPDAAGDSDTLLDALDEAVRAGLILEEGRSYVFAHALIRTTLYTELTSARRTRLHRRVGEAIESRPDADRRVEALAYHFAEAALDGQERKAVDYGLAAGRQALEHLAQEEAIGHLERARSVLDLMDGSDAVRGADLAYVLATTHWSLGNRALAREEALRVAEIARQLSDSDRLAQAGILLTALSELAVIDDVAAGVCEEALATLPATHIAMRVRTLSALAVYRTMSELDGVRGGQLAEEAVTLARELGDDQLLAPALNARLMGLAPPDQRRPLAEEFLDATMRLRDPRGLADARLAMSMAALAEGDLTEFTAQVRALRQLADEQPWWYALAWAAIGEAAVATLHGDVDDADVLCAKAFALAGTDQTIALAVAGLRALMFVGTGRGAQLIEVVELFEALAPRLTPEMGMLRAVVSVLEGDFDSCRRQLAELVADGRLQLSMGPLRPIALGMMASTAFLAEDARFADLLYEELLPYSGYALVMGLIPCTTGPADLQLGSLAALAGRWDLADLHFGAAEEFETAFGSGYLAGLAPMYHAMTLGRRSDPGDRQRLLDLAERAGASVLAEIPTLKSIVRGLLRPPLPSALAGSRTFVGRTVELARVDAQRQRSAEGGTTALVSGEPGIGKTHLATEAARRAYDDAALVLFGRCDEDLGLPYQPFAEGLSHYVTNTPPSVTLLGHLPGELVRIAPDLATRISDLPPALQTDGETERQRLFDAVAGWLRAVAEHTPVLLVLDDLHWASKPTLLLLRHLLRSDLTNVCIIGTYRDTELDRVHPLAEVLADLRREPNVDRIVLGGFDEADARSFVAAAAEQDLSVEGEELADALRTETDGNPFFMGEVMRHLVDTGAVRRDGDLWSLEIDSIADAGLPEGVREVITRRVGRLSEHANRLLAVAAVVGASFDHALLARLPEAATDDESLLDALEEAVRAGILVETGMRHAFSHALIRKTLYDELSNVRRTRLHRRIGEAIEASPDAEDHGEALAYHFAEAAIDGQADKAVTYGLAAARRARQHLAHEEAIAHIDRAMAIIELGGEDEAAVQSDLHYERASARWALGDRAAARADALLAAERAARAEDRARLALAAILLVSLVGFANSDDAVAHTCERALAQLDEGDRRLRARVLAALARYRSYCELDATTGAALADEAISLAEELGDDEALIGAIGARLLALPLPEVREALWPRLATLAETSGDSAVLAEAIRQRAVAAVCRGDRNEYRSCVEALRGIGATRHWWWATAQATIGDAIEALFDSRVADAEALAAAALASGGTDTDVAVAAGSIVAICTIIRFDTETYARLLEMIMVGQAPNLARDVRVLGGHPAVSLLTTEERVALLDEVTASGRPDVTNGPTRLLCLAVLAEVASEVGHGHCAELVYEQLLPYAGSFVTFGSFALAVTSADRALGSAAMAVGRFDDAERHFLSSLAMDRKLGVAWQVAWTGYRYAELLRQARPHEIDRIVELITEARDVATEVGLSWLAQVATEDLAELSSTDKPT
jgi:predicted ATPase/DNA-binding SARP family transcriptional activator